MQPTRCGRLEIEAILLSTDQIAMKDRLERPTFREMLGAKVSLEYSTWKPRFTEKPQSWEIILFGSPNPWGFYGLIRTDGRPSSTKSARGLAMKFTKKTYLVHISLAYLYEQLI